MELLQKLPFIYDAAISENNWSTTLDHLSEAFQAKGTILYASNNTVFEYSINSTNSFYDNKMHTVGEYLERFRHYDLESIGTVFRAKTFVPVLDTSIWPELIYEGENSRDDIQWIGEKLDLRRRLGINVSTNSAWNAALVLQYDSSFNSIDQTHLLNANVLTPHLAKALEINRFYSQLHQYYDAILSVLDHVDIGVCVLTSSGHVAISNQKSNAFFDEKNGLYIDRYKKLISLNDTITAKIYNHTMSIAQTARGENNQHEFTFTVPKKSGGDSYLLELSPLRDSNGEFEKKFSGSILTIIDPDAPPPIKVLPFAKLFGLTKSEAEVAELLTSGKTLESVSDIRGVAFDTIKNQCKAIYAKADVVNRTQLLRKIISISPPIKRDLDNTK